MASDVRVCEFELSFVMYFRYGWGRLKLWQVTRKFELFIYLLFFFFTGDSAISAIVDPLRINVGIKMNKKISQGSSDGRCG